MRLTLRSRAAFLVRNSALIYTFLLSPIQSLNLSSSNYKYLRQLRYLGDKLFIQLSKTLFPKPKFIKYTPLGLNFPTSAHRQSMLYIDSALRGKYSTFWFAPVSQYTIKYPYFLGNSVAITPISKRPFSLTLYKFLRMNLDLWFSWPRVYMISTNYTNIKNSWLLLKFLNNYFFKVYNL